MRFLAIGLINVYQRYLSPHKGFCCAHAALHQGDSCSQAIKTSIKTNGVFAGYGLIRRRLDECKAAYALLSEKRKNKQSESKEKGKQEKDNKCHDGCGTSSVCEAGACMFRKGSCDLPDSPCDCSL